MSSFKVMDLVKVKETEKFALIKEITEDDTYCITYIDKEYRGKVAWFKPKELVKIGNIFEIMMRMINPERKFINK